MTDKHTLIAFCAVLAAICYLYTLAVTLAYFGRYAEALGLGGAGTGLIGVLGTFRPSKPASVGTADPVNSGAPPAA